MDQTQLIFRAAPRMNLYLALMEAVSEEKQMNIVQKNPSQPASRVSFISVISKDTNS